MMTEWNLITHTHTENMQPEILTSYACKHQQNSNSNSYSHNPNCNEKESHYYLSSNWFFKKAIFDWYFHLHHLYDIEWTDKWRHLVFYHLKTTLESSWENQMILYIMLILKYSKHAQGEMNWMIEFDSLVTVPLTLFSLIMLMLCWRRMMLLLLKISRW